MFKSARWRSEKNRIKAEFKLQFCATQVFSGSEFLIVLGFPGKSKWCLNNKLFVVSDI